MAAKNSPILAAALLALTLAACGGDAPVAPSPTPTPTAAPAMATDEPIPAAEPTVEPTPEPTPEPTVEAAAEAMDLAQIRGGDYSTVDGTWAAPNGDELTIAGSRIDWILGATGAPFATVDALTFSLGDDGDQAEAVVDDPAAVEPQGGDVASLWWTIEERGFPHGSMLVFLPAGAPGASVLGVDSTSDASIDRILVLTGIAVGRLLPGDLTPFVATRSDAAAPAETPDPSAECSPPVPGAFDCAGRPVPDEATEVRTVLKFPYGSTAILTTPSGNIGCDITTVDGEDPVMDCQVRSWLTDPPVAPVNTGDGDPWLSFGDGSAPPEFGGSRGDPFCYRPGACPTDDGPMEPQVVEYGQVVHYAGFVCASAQDGLTCWNADTGHGALISRTVFAPF